MLLGTKAMRPARNLARTMASVSRNGPPPHLLTLADLSPAQLTSLLQSAITFKHLSKTVSPTRAEQTLDARTVALLFSKRSTRTRVASETSAKILGGHPLFLGSADSQLGVNETLEDTARVVGSMVDGIMARVNRHEEVAVSQYPAQRHTVLTMADISRILACSSHQCPLRPVSPDPDLG